jgi:hypothetical protein
VVIYGSITHEKNKPQLPHLPIHIHVKQLEDGGNYIHIIKKPCLVNLLLTQEKFHNEGKGC